MFQEQVSEPFIKLIERLVVLGQIKGLHSRLRINIFKMSNGTVKFFNNSKGFGFITPEEGDKDVFVHINGLVDEINEGDKVSFDVQEGPKGLNAVNVRVI